ncbi:sensor domain-containing diguanylate cyclase [Photobacterium rosenbergii]|uniref:diguanylate cyclase n=1 Tax=Photobacterium rosenbergii TaxID=294936 RepID=A0A2T3NHN4_9GAMM|nr:sensor domain-containing diguanylate cyclase [Photobacterium rosenbergii]
MLAHLRNNLNRHIQVLLALLVVLTAMPIGFLWHQSAVRIVHHTIENIYQHASQAVINHLDEFFTDANKVYEHQERIQSELSEVVKDRTALLHHITNVLNHHDEIDYFYFGNMEGGLLSAGHQGNQRYFLIETENGKAGQLNHFESDHFGSKGELINSTANFDVRTKQWFQNATKVTYPVWSNIYAGAFDPSLLGITLSKAQRDDNGKLLGVWGLDLTLNTVIQELSKSKLSEHGDVVLFYKNQVILASTSESHQPKGGALTKISHSTAPILNKLINEDHNKGNSLLLVEHKGQEWAGFITDYTLAKSDLVKIAFYSPMTDFAPELVTAQRVAILLTIILVIIAILLGRKAAGHIRTPIQSLTQAAEQISQGRWGSQIAITRDDDLGTLAKSFNKMQHNLELTIHKLDSQQQETKRLNALLAQQNQELEARVKERTQALSTANAKLQQMAYFDALTGIANRRYFWQQLDEKCIYHRGWLLILDIDNFKHINDAYGHLEGDNILKHFTATCLAVLPEKCLFGRIGGEEFALWLADLSRKEVEAITQTLLTALTQTPYRNDGISVVISTSIGASRCTANPQKSYAVADKLLYEAKLGGKNRAVIELDD